MSKKLTGKIKSLVWVIGGLLMIIGIGFGEFSVKNKISIIGLIVALVASQCEIERLRKIIHSLKNDN